MSSISSAQGVVERASAELSKRINGLGLRSKHHHASNNNSSTSSSSASTPTSSSPSKTSVMERVTNALCGGSGNSNSNSIQSATNSSVTPEKPSRSSGGVQQPQQPQAPSQTISTNTTTPSSQTSTPLQTRKQLPNPLSIHHQMLQQQLQKQQLHSKKVIPPTSLTVDQLFLDDRFLSKFFMYFSPYERCILAQVCMKWRDLLYRSPRYWSGLIPTLQCRELRQFPNPDRVKLYNSLIRRGFHALSLIGAQDEDALDVVHSFPLASKHIHSLSLKCSSISDRGMEALLDHLQVSIVFNFVSISWFRVPVTGSFWGYFKMWLDGWAWLNVSVLSETLKWH